MGCCKRCGRLLGVHIGLLGREQNLQSREIRNTVAKQCNYCFSKCLLIDDRLRVWAQDRLSRFLEAQEAESAFDEMTSILELVSSKEGKFYLHVIIGNGSYLWSRRST